MDPDTVEARVLQVSTLANEGVSEGDGASYLFPYIIGVLSTLGIMALVFQYFCWWFCKYILGREDPIDIDHVMANLTQKQRELVLQHILHVGGGDGGGAVETTADPLQLHEQEDHQLHTSTAGTLKTEHEGTSEEDLSTRKELHEEREHEEQAVLTTDENPSPSRDLSKSVKKDIEYGSTQERVSLPPPPTEEAEEPSSSSCWMDDDLDSDRAVCPICIGRLERTHFAIYKPRQCTHQFHADCILEWLVHSSKSNNDCPVCRAEVVTQDEMIQTTLQLMKEYPGWEELGQVSTDGDKI